MSQLPVGQNSDELDETDLRILSEFRKNGRISMAAMANAVNISRASAYSRVDKLVANGVILGFSAEVDPRKVGLEICALVFVTIHPQGWSTFHKAIVQFADVEYCAITTGEHDAMLIIRAVSMVDVHYFVTSEVAVRPEVKSVESVVVLDELIRRPFLLPSDIPDRSADVQQLGMTRWVPAAAGRGAMRGEHN